jgi:hypothetical protein
MKIFLVPHQNNNGNQGRTQVETRAQICRRAYELYQRRGKADGNALQDWLQAEAEVLGRTELKRAA